MALKHQNNSQKIFSFLKTLVITLLLFTFHFSLGQESDTTETTKDTLTVETPTSIPTIEIIQSAAKTLNGLKVIEDKYLENKLAVHKIDSLYSNYASFIENQKKSTTTLLATYPNLQKTNQIYSKWNRYKIFLQKLEEETIDYTAQNKELLEAITLHQQTWNLTAENNNTETTPTEVQERITTLLIDIEKIQNDIIAENNFALTVESKINFKIEEISEVMDNILLLKDSKIYNIFYLRHQPIWKSSPKVKTDTSETSIKESARVNINETISFIKANSESLNLYFTLIIILIGLFFFLKKKILQADLPENHPNRDISSEIIIKHKTASIIFFALFIGYFFFKGMPKLFENIIVLLLLFSSSFVVRTQIKEKFQILYFFIITFYLIDAIKNFLWLPTNFYRFYLLIEASLIAIAVYLLTQRLRQIKSSNKVLIDQLLHKITKGLYIFTFVSFTAIILGYTNLAELILKISSNIGAIAIIFYCLFLILQGALIIIIYNRFRKRPDLNAFQKKTFETKIMKFTIFLVLFLGFLIFLRMVDLLKPVTEYFQAILTEPYKIGDITITIGAILSFVLILAISFLLTGFVTFLIDDGDGILKFLQLPKGIPSAISIVVRYFILAFGFIFALSSLGMDLSKFNLLAGAMGIGIGFGLQTIISNFISGLILVFERPILQGDTVEVDNLIGVVNKIGVRSSSIKTFDGAEVIVPNYNLMSNNLINWTLSDNTSRLEILIGASYDTDPNQVLELLTEAALSVEHVLKYPKPNALFIEFGDNSLNFALHFWTHYEKRLIAKSDVSIAVYNIFKKHNISIPFPQQDVYIKNLPDKG